MKKSLISISNTELLFGSFSYLAESVGKKSAYRAVDPGSIPGLGRSAGEEIGYPLQYS